MICPSKSTPSTHKHKVSREGKEQGGRNYGGKWTSQFYGFDSETI